MVLRKRVVDIPLAGGIDQKTSEKSLKAPNLLKLENGRYLKEGKIDKRLGYTNLNQDIDTGTLNTPTTLGAIRNELLMLSADRLYSYSTKYSEWQERGQQSTANTKLEHIGSSTASSITELDVIVHEGIRVALWVDTLTYYAVYDNDTNAVIVEPTAFAAATDRHRLVACAGVVNIVYEEGVTSNQIDSLRIPTSNPTNTSVNNPFNAALRNFEVFGFEGFWYAIHRISSPSNGIEIKKLDPLGAVIATKQFLGPVPDNIKCMAVHAFTSTSESKDVVCFGWSESTTIKGLVVDTDFSEVVNTTTMQTVGASPDSLVIVPNSLTGSTIGYFIGVTAGNTYDYTTQLTTLTLSSGATATHATDFLGSVAPVSNGIYRNGVGYFNVLHESTLQSTYFTVDTNGNIVAKFAAGQGPQHSNSTRLSNFTAIDSNGYLFGVLKKSRIRSENATLYANLDGKFATLSFDPAKGPIATNMHDDYVIAGGILRSYDSDSVHEYGFHLYPENTTAAATSGGSMNDGTYLVQAIYEWVDNRGIKYQSAPSISQSVTTSGTDNQVTVTIPSLLLTDKGDIYTTNSKSVLAKVYITENNATIPYLAATVTNAGGATTVSTIITADPSTFTGNEILYTTGGALENIAPDSCSYIFTHDNRPVLLGVEEPNQIRIGKDLKPATSSGFNEDLVITLDPFGGDIIAGASMDNYMIIFKETATYAISGAGPNDLGIGSTYSNPQLISSDIGCKDIKSVLQTPDGIVVKTNKGIYILTRGLEYTYIGSNVEDHNTDTILSSNLLTDSHEIRFVTDANVTLVYNYFFKWWSTFTTFGALDAVIWQGSKYVYLTSTKVLQEDSSTYMDDGSYVTTKIKTGWIRLNTLQGYQRAYRVALLGEYHNDHLFQVKQFYDYADTVVATTNITASDIVSSSVYGGGATYGSDAYYGGTANDEVHQPRIHLKKQKCESISFEISDSMNTANASQGFSLEGISLELGGKSGIFRTSNARTK